MVGLTILKSPLEYEPGSQSVGCVTCNLCWRPRPFSRLRILKSSKTATGPGSAPRRSVTPSRSSHMDNPPSTNIHTIVKAQIVFLLSTLTEENFERNQVEIRSVSLSSALALFNDILIEPHPAF